MKNIHRKIKIGIIDSGINFKHHLLNDKKPKGISFDIIGAQITATSNFFDVNGHGTACAGIISEKVPDAELFSIKILNHNLQSRGDILAKAIEWSIDNEINVLNISLGTISSKHRVNILKACRQAYKNNIVLVSAVNNKGMCSYPADFNEVIAVDAAKIDDDKKIFYQENKKTWIAKGDPQLVAGLSQDMLLMGGTSMAAPHLTGIVAAFWEKQANFNLAEVKNYLKSRADEPTKEQLKYFSESKDQDFSLSRKEQETIKKQYLEELIIVTKAIREVAGLKEDFGFNDCLFKHRGIWSKHFYQIALSLSKTFGISFNKVDFCLEGFYTPLNIAKKILEKVNIKEKNQCLSALTN